MTWHGIGGRWCPLLLLFSLFLASACGPQPIRVTREPVTLQLVAADSCAPLAARAAKAYEDSHPWVSVQVEVFNTAVAEEVLREGGADIALLSWVWGSDEEGSDFLWREALTVDSVAVIVHPESSLSELGVAHLREIFFGRLQEWGGGTFAVVSREEGSGTRAAFESIVLDGESTTINAVVMPSSEAMVEYVADTPAAIGYVSADRLDEGVRVLPIEGALPTKEAVSNGTYPLWQQVYVASHGEPVGEAREFAQWLLLGGGVEGVGGRVDS